MTKMMKENIFRITKEDVHIPTKRKETVGTNKKYIIEDDLWKELIPNEDIRDKFQNLWILESTVSSNQELYA